MSQQTLPCNPPPPKRSRVGSFFSHRCLVSPKFFPKEKVDFVGDIALERTKTWFYVITTEAQFQQG